MLFHKFRSGPLLVLILDQAFLFLEIEHNEVMNIWLGHGPREQRAQNHSCPRLQCFPRRLLSAPARTGGDGMKATRNSRSGRGRAGRRLGARIMAAREKASLFGWEVRSREGACTDSDWVSSRTLRVIHEHTPTLARARWRGLCSGSCRTARTAAAAAAAAVTAAGRRRQ